MSLLRKLDLSSFFLFSSCVLLLAVTGCDLAQGLNDVGGSLTNPDAALLDRPGRKIASGQFHNLLIDGSIDEGGRVIALKKREDGQDLVIIPYLKGDSCSIPSVFNFGRLSSRVDIELKGLLTVQGDIDNDGRGAISFVDFNCKKAFEGLPHAALPQVLFPAAPPRGILALTGTEELYFADAVNRQLTAVSTQVSQARSFLDELWSVEQGELVVRDQDLNERTRFGKNISFFELTGGKKIEVAFMDDDGLSTWSEAEGVTLLSSTGCAPTSWDANTIAYFDPCESRKLAIHTIGSNIGASTEFVRLVGPEGVVQTEEAIVSWGRGKRPSEISFLLGDAGANRGKLLLAEVSPFQADEDPKFAFTTQTMAEENAHLEGGHMYLNWDNTSGTLVRYLRDKEGTSEIMGLVELADGVIQIPGGSPFSRRGVLAEFDGVTGTLTHLSLKNDQVVRTPLATSVPVQLPTIDFETGRTAFIGESSDGFTGTLFITPPTDATSAPLDPKPVATNVQINSMRFLDQPAAIAYFYRKEGARYPQLRAWLIDSGITLTVHERVSEYRTVPWPAPGILYAVPDGSAQGLWFSKAR